MKTRIWRSGPAPRRAAATLLSLPLLALLAGGCSETQAPPDEILPPVASAGANQNAPLGQIVTLNGTGSNDPNQLYLQYTWSFINRPAGSNAAIQNRTEPFAQFVPDADGLYVITLTVNNGHHADTDTIRVATADGPPDVLNQNIIGNTRLRNLYDNPHAADYVLTAQIEVTAQLTIDAGVRIETRAGTRITVREGGAVLAVGTAGEPIIIDGMKWRRGYWRGFDFVSGSPTTNVFAHVDIANGGRTEEPSANFYVRSGAGLTVTNSVIRDSDTWGVFLQPGAQFVGSGNTYRNNTLGDVNGP
jgi:hypothetical protein